MRVLITRPASDARALADTLAARGLDVVIAPLLDIEFTPVDGWDLAGVQAVLFTSANGVRAFAHQTDARDLPAYCVGDATAHEAERAGFARVATASGDVEDLARLATAELEPRAGDLLHPAGSHVAGDLASLLKVAGFTYRRVVLYRAKTVETLPDVARGALGAGDVDGVLLYSPRTAKTFARLVRAANLKPALHDATAYCLSPAVAAEVEDLPWHDVRVAPTPEGAALLALLDPDGET